VRKYVIAGLIVLTILSLGCDTKRAAADAGMAKTVRLVTAKVEDSGVPASYSAVVFRYQPLLGEWGMPFASFKDT